jgi:hypothetical protein
MSKESRVLREGLQTSFEAIAEQKMDRKPDLKVLRRVTPNNQENLFKTSNDFGLLNHQDGNCNNQLKF